MEKITGDEPINFVEQWGNQDAKMYGLTIRQHFAAMVMTKVEPPKTFVGEKETHDSFSDWAAKCNKMATYMIAELNKPITQ